MIEKEDDYGRFRVFSDEELVELRDLLLNHYETNQRVLPWRFPNTTSGTQFDTECSCIKDTKGYCNCSMRYNKIDRGYCVWISEIMLQQTQVATVIPYFHRWMAVFPTIESVASASEDAVYSLWTGLGYYSRARRIWETAKSLTTANKGIPVDPVDIERSMSGVGRYTSAAIASIAYNQPVATVDGNIFRIYSRLRAIGQDITLKRTVDAIWKLAQSAVDKNYPGDHNQALMDIGATICTPKQPNCTECPLSSLCMAYKESTQGITSLKEQSVFAKYPFKPPKKKSREEDVLVLLIHHIPTNAFLLTKRPKEGLLANMSEFVCTENDVLLTTHQDRQINHASKNEIFRSQLNAILNLTSQYIAENIKIIEVGIVKHVFSHINCRYHVNYTAINGISESHMVDSKYSWVKHDDLKTHRLSTGMQKALERTLQMINENTKVTGTKRQKTITSYL